MDKKRDREKRGHFALLIIRVLKDSCYVRIKILSNLSRDRIAYFS